MFERFVESLKARSEAILIWKAIVNGIVFYLELIAKFSDVSAKMRHFVDGIPTGSRLGILSDATRSFFYEVNIDALVAFISFENVEYRFVKAVDESFHRNVSLMFELSKERVVI